MPDKKKKGKKGKKKTKSGGTREKDDVREPMAPEVEVPPPPKPGERLLKLLLTHEVKEKELYGMTVSTRALEKLTPQEISDLHIVFEAFDMQSRGFLGPVETRKALRVLGFKVNRDEARAMVQDASSQGKGMIDFNEFLDIIIEQQGDSRDIYEEIMQGFKMLDYDNAGKISSENLKQACKETSTRLNKQEIQDMMEEADLNGDGYVDREEFVKIMLQTNLF